MMSMFLLLTTSIMNYLAQHPFLCNQILSSTSNSVKGHNSRVLRSLEISAHALVFYNLPVRTSVAIGRYFIGLLGASFHRFQISLMLIHNQGLCKFINCTLVIYGSGSWSDNAHLVKVPK